MKMNKEGYDCTGIFSTEKPVEFMNFEKRLKTYKLWDGCINPEILALAGFYYTSNLDVVKCIYCGVCIFKWNQTDCPFEEHFRLSNSCLLAKNLLLYKQTEYFQKRQFKMLCKYFMFMLFMSNLLILCLNKV